MFHFPEALLKDRRQMNPYVVYNVALMAFILPISYWLAGTKNRKRNLMLSARVAFLVTLISYPWDFFAIHLGIWRYPHDPGLRIYGVPVNDLVFIYFCSLLTCSLLTAFNGWKPNGQRHSQCKDPGEHNTSNKGIGSS